MDRLRAAASLSRALLSLADAKRTGILRVEAGQRRAELQLLHGAIVSIQGVDGELLGDALLRDGELDARVHGAALSAAEPNGPVGHWLVAVGAASREAVDRALLTQLDRRLSALLRFVGPSVRFIEQAAQVRDVPAASIQVAPALWDGLIELARSLTNAELERLSVPHALRLTRAGEQWASSLVQAGKLGDLAPLLKQASGSVHERAVLCALGLAVDARVDPDAFSLLLRKQRQIRRHVSPEALLDLPERAAPDQARRALRRLAQKLHPDRFSTELPALRAVSHEVMRALFRAEESLRTPPLSRHAAR